MNSPETMQMLLKNISEIKDTVSALNERSKNYYDMLDRQDRKIQDSNKQIQGITHRVEKIEIALANIDIIKEHAKKIDEMYKDITILKRDKWWIGMLAGVIGSFLGFVLHLIFCS